MARTAHIDRFVLDRLPPPEQQPELIFSLPELAYPDQLNAGVELLRRAIAAAGPDARALIDHDLEFTWSRVDAISSRMARVLVEDMGLVPGNRVLLHGPNSSWTVLAWFAVLKAGGVVCATMPMLRASELATVIDAAVQIFGGLGVVSGNPVERLYREIRALRIYEGASEVQKIVIARQALAAIAGDAHG